MNQPTPVARISADTVITAGVVTNEDGSKYGRVVIGPPGHTPPFGAEATLLANSPDTLDSLAEAVGVLANELRAATS